MAALFKNRMAPPDSLCFASFVKLGCRGRASRFPRRAAEAYTPQLAESKNAEDEGRLSRQPHKDGR
jgi:hypothetical protein